MKKLLLLLLFFLVSCTGIDEPDAETHDAKEAIVADAVADVVVIEETPGVPERGVFPSLHINGVDGRRIDRNEWMRDVTLTLVSDVPGHSFSDVGIRLRGRGNSTWGMEKRPFRIRLDDSAGRAMMDSGHTGRDWTLIASHSDKTLMRHYIAYHFSHLMGTMHYSPWARFVHLYIDGDYRGVYLFGDQIRPDVGQPSMIYNDDPALSEFLIEINYRAHHGGAVLGVDFVRINGMQYEWRFPRGDLMTPAHLSYMVDFITHVDGLIMSRRAAALDYICIPSFVDHYILMELFKCVDAGRLSTFMQIRGTGENRRIEMGPVWDFDLAIGNAYYLGNPHHTLDNITHHYRYLPYGVWQAHVSRWDRMLMLNPVFFDAVVERWAELRENQFPALIDHINFMATHYQAEFERNFERWPIMGRYVWPNPQVVVGIDTFMGQVEYLTNFLETRAAWLEEHFWR